MDVPPRSRRATLSKPVLFVVVEYFQKKHRPEISVDRERQTWMLFVLPCKLVVDFGWNIFGIITNNIPRLSIKTLNHIVKEPSPEKRSS